MTLLVIFAHEDGQDEVAMLQKQFLHSSAMIEKFFNYSQYFISIFEMSGEPVNVYQYVNQWDVRQDVQLAFIQRCIKVRHLGQEHLSILAYIKVQLAKDNFIKLLENSIGRRRLVFLMLALYYFVHSI